MGQLRDEQRQRAISALNGFLSTPLSNLVQPSEDRGVNSVLQLFQDVVTKVPAYQQFLATHHRSIDDIQTWEDFQTLPLITKENYLCQYSLSQLCRHGQLETCDLIAVSSGSTGNPTFRPVLLVMNCKLRLALNRFFMIAFKRINVEL